MQLCGLVLEFSQPLDLPQCTLDALQNWPGCTLGEMVENRQPIVVEADNARDAQTWHERLADLEGVEQVYVAYVGFDGESMPLIENEPESNYVI